MTVGNEIRISVRDLVEFVYRSGDLDSRFAGMGKAIEGARLHQKIQGLPRVGSPWAAEETVDIRYHPFVTQDKVIERRPHMIAIGHSGVISALVQPLIGAEIVEQIVVQAAGPHIDRMRAALHFEHHHVGPRV